MLLSDLLDFWVMEGEDPADWELELEIVGLTTFTDGL